MQSTTATLYDCFDSKTAFEEAMAFAESIGAKALWSDATKMAFVVRRAAMLLSIVSGGRHTVMRPLPAMARLQRELESQPHFPARTQGGGTPSNARILPRAES